MSNETMSIGELVLERACRQARQWLDRDGVDALIDVGIDFAWCQSRFRLLPKPKAQAKPQKVSAPREKETVR